LIDAAEASGSRRPVVAEDAAGRGNPQPVQVVDETAVRSGAGEPVRRWVGTSMGLARLDGRGTPRTWTRKDGLGGDNVRWLGETSDGAVWAVVKPGSVARIDPATGKIRLFGTTALVIAARSPRCSSMTLQAPSRRMAKPLSVGTMTDPSRRTAKAPQNILGAISGFSCTNREASGGFRYSLPGLRTHTEPSGVVPIASQEFSGNPSAGPNVVTRPRSSTQSRCPQPNQS
jgi:hypothetical protein